MAFTFLGEFIDYQESHQGRKGRRKIWGLLDSGATHNEREIKDDEDY